MSLFCSNAVSNPNVEASLTTRVSKCWLKYYFPVISDLSRRVFWNADVTYGFQSKVLSLFDLFSSSLSVDAVFVRFGIYLVRWCIEPMKLFSCSNDFGGESMRIASVFRISDIVPSRLIMLPSQLTCLNAVLQFSYKLLSSRQLIFLLVNKTVLCVYPFDLYVTIRMSSR